MMIAFRLTVGRGRAAFTVRESVPVAGSVTPVLGRAHTAVLATRISTGCEGISHRGRQVSAPEYSC